MFEYVWDILQFALVHGIEPANFVPLFLSQTKYFSQALSVTDKLHTLPNLKSSTELHTLVYISEMQFMQGANS